MPYSDVLLQSMTNLEALIESALNSFVQHKSEQIRIPRTSDSILSEIVSLSSFSNSSRLQYRPGSPLSIFLKRCVDILRYPTTESTTRSRLLLILFNINLYNVPIRRFLSYEPDTHPSIIKCLQFSVADNLGPQNIIDVLRLLQNEVGGVWVDDLLLFLSNEILCPDEPEWMVYCVAIMNNLVMGSKTILSKIKEMKRFDDICNKLLQMLSHNSRTIVVSSLSLIDQIDEKLRKTVYSQQNISQTFLCIFNVLSQADLLMTVHIAVDLLKRLVINHQNMMLNHTAKNFTSFASFEKSIQKVANLLTILDPCSEESYKVYDLIASFCAVQELSGPVCAAILAVAPTQRRLTTPLSSICRTASMPFDEVISPNIPLFALKLLNHLLKEANENNIDFSKILIADYVSLLQNNLKTPLEFITCRSTGIGDLSFLCKRVLEGFRLLEVISNDDASRCMLIELMDTSTCSRIYEALLDRDPTQTQKFSLTSDCTDALSVERVNITMQLIKFLAALKDHSKPHKDLYWRSLKDDRLIPIIAFALVSGSTDIVYDAFTLFNHCSQVQEFSLKRLAETLVMLSNNISFQRISSSEQNNFCNGSLKNRPFEHATLDIIQKLTEKEFLEFESTASKFIPILEERIKEEKRRHDNEIVIIEKEKALLAEDNEKERALQAILKTRFDEMTKKFDIAAGAILSKNEEIDRLKNIEQMNARRINELESELQDLKNESVKCSDAAKIHVRLMKISDEANKKLQKENDEIKLMIDSIQKIITNKF